MRFFLVILTINLITGGLGYVFGGVSAAALFGPLGMAVVLLFLLPYLDRDSLRNSAKQYVFIASRSETDVYRYKCEVHAKTLGYWLLGTGTGTNMYCSAIGDTVEDVILMSRRSLKAKLEAYEENEKGDGRSYHVVLRSDILRDEDQ